MIPRVADTEVQHARRRGSDAKMRREEVSEQEFSR